VHLTVANNYVQDYFPQVGVFLVDLVGRDCLQVLNSQKESDQVQVPVFCLVQAFLVGQGQSAAKIKLAIYFSFGRSPSNAALQYESKMS